MRYFLLTMWALFTVSSANYPVFEGANQLKELLIPADVHIGSVIYRLRASDSDHNYPLQFDATDYGSYVVRVENLPCDVNSTYCEANVYLERVLMAGQVFKFRFTVRDTKGDTTTVSASIEATDASVDITAIFPHLPGIIVLPENMKLGAELEYVIVRKHPEYKKPPTLEIRGSAIIDFGRIRSSQETTTGVITLKKNLDFEQQNMYKLQIFALDMYTDKLVDSRNIAGFEIILIIEDVQDTPPIFTRIEQTIKLRSNLTQGDVITKVTAVDGDKGNPRQIKYGLVSENNPFTIFFNIDRITGQIMLAKPLKQLTAIARSYQPILLSILAEEEKLNPNDLPSMSTTATIALLLADAGNTAPYFDNDHYVCHLDENSVQGTTLVFNDAYSTQVHDDDMGKHGVFSLILDQNNGTFEITPSVVERKAYFTIRVRNKLLLDYETRQSVHFVIVARELDPSSLSSSATVLVYLNDINDNPPQFQKTVYMAQIPENATANSFLTEVKATDIDTGISGRVHYTRILGFQNSSLLLNPVSGIISIATDNHGFDREESSEYQMTVEARDMEGLGLLTTVQLIIRILDVNDETPIFENSVFHFTLTSDLRNFSTRAFVKATDKDAESPNNIIRYEIINGNYNNKFFLNSDIGELTIRDEGLNNRRKRRQALNPSNPNVYSLTVRAYDLGVPHRWTTAQVHIFPPDTGTRLLNFILPAKGLFYERLEELLVKISGGQINIIEIKPYHQRRYSRAVMDVAKKQPSNEKSLVVARVTYGDNSMIDVEQVFYLLQNIFSGNTENTNKMELETAEIGTIFFWILLIILLILIIILISVLLCYLWKCFPSINNFYKNKKANRISDEVEAKTLRNKGVQANNSLETRSSADSNLRNRSWKFYRRREPEPQPVLLIPKNISPIHYRNVPANNDVPAFIYRNNLNTMERHGDLYIQDIADTEYCILDPAKLNVHRLNESSNTEIKNLNESNKTLGDRYRNITPQNREEMFVREGNAEILRLQTNTEPIIKNNVLNQSDKIMDKFQKNSIKEIQDENGKYQNTIQQFYDTDEVSQEQYEDNVQITPQPTVKNDECEIQSPLHYVQQTQMKNDEIEIEEKLTNDILKQSTISDPHSTVVKSSSEESLEKKIGKDDFRQISHLSSITNHLDTNLRTENETIRNLLNISHLEEERNKLTTFQRDLLLTRFLVEEQRRFLNQAGDTISLPGSLSMATQTDRHRATQTDVLCMMRPEPRKVKSENDDSSDSDIDGLGKGRKSRHYALISNDKNRCKIRTPIIEEAENSESLRNSGTQVPHRENRSSKLRMTNNRNKLTNGKVEQKPSKICLKKNKYRSTTDVNDLSKNNERHVSLKDAKKSISFSNVKDACFMLSEKEIYTPRSLKSRLIARRLSVSEPPKIGIHSTEKQKVNEKNVRTPEQNRKYGENRVKDEKRRLQQQKNIEIGSMEKINSKNENDLTKNGINVILVDENVESGSAAVVGTTLKLKGKNQQLMEKKSVFTIAYDDATTEHLGASSNGSVQE